MADCRSSNSNRNACRHVVQLVDVDFGQAPMLEAGCDMTCSIVLLERGRRERGGTPSVSLRSVSRNSRSSAVLVLRSHPRHHFCSLRRAGIRACASLVEGLRARQRARCDWDDRRRKRSSGLVGVSFKERLASVAPAACSRSLRDRRKTRNGNAGERSARRLVPSSSSRGRRRHLRQRRAHVPRGAGPPTASRSVGSMLVRQGCESRR